MDENIKQYIDKSAIVAEIERIEYETNYEPFTDEVLGKIKFCKDIKDLLNTLEAKEEDLNNSIQLTWEDMRELHIIFAEVDTEIELCKCDVQIATIGYYQEVLKRFKAQKKENKVWQKKVNVSLKDAATTVNIGGLTVKKNLQ